MESLNIPRCACRGPCGAVSGKEPNPIPAGAHRPTDGRRRRKEMRIEHQRPP